MNRTDIAIIGLAGRFPGARTVEELAENLRRGVDSVAHPSRERIAATALPENDEYWPRGYLEDIDCFDHEFFGISRGEAEAMDPAQRLLLEVSHEALNNSGYGSQHFAGSNTSVVLSAVFTDYQQHADTFSPVLISGNVKDFYATRIARTFDFTGNALMLDTACSSALVALQVACNELALGMADHALVGSVNLFIFPHQEDSAGLGMWASDGRSHSFSDRADGMSQGELAACLLLKPLTKALKDEDIIHAVIKSVAVNNNGARSSSPSAPDSVAQAAVLERAWKNAGIHPQELGYIEAHGSGTQLGDSLEAEGLNLAFKAFGNPTRPCPISTIKSNIGHSMSAAGMAGLIRAILSLKHRVLFPAVHWDPPSTLIDWQSAAVAVQRTLEPWPANSDHARTAGVTALGMSGTNAHAVLQEGIRSPAAQTPDGPTLLTLSARSPNGLHRNLSALRMALEKKSELRLRDVAFTLNTGREHFAWRFSCLENHANDLLETLRQAEEATAQDTLSPEASDRFGTQESTPRRLIAILSELSGDLGPLLSALSSTPSVNRHLGNLAETPETLPYEAQACLVQYGLMASAKDLGVTFDGILAVGLGKLVEEVTRGRVSLEEAFERSRTWQPQPLENLAERLTAIVRRESADGPVAFLQMGPEGPLSRGLRELALDPDLCQVHRVHLDGKGQDPLQGLLSRLYLQGCPINFKRYHEVFPGRKVELPGYPFERSHCWLRETPKIFDQPPPPRALESPSPQVGGWSEDQLATLWSDVLAVDAVGPEDDFFDLGGTSLKATQVIQHLNRAFTLDLNFEDLFDFPTPRTLATYIESLNPPTQTTIERLFKIWREVLKSDEVAADDSFFDLGGHSLLANQVLLKIGAEFGVELSFEDFFEHPTPRALNHLMEQGSSTSSHARRSDLGDILPVEQTADALYPASPNQRWLWALSKRTDASMAFHTICPFLIKGSLDPDALAQGIRDVIDRHEILRTVFVPSGGEVKQKVCRMEEIGFALESNDSSGSTPLPEFLEQIARQEEETPFDLARGPLLRAKLLRLAHAEYLVVFTFHHIISDGWSIDVFYRDLFECYRGAVEKRPIQLPPLTIQHKEYSAWLARLLGEDRAQRDREFWQERFGDLRPTLALPLDQPRPPKWSYRGEGVTFSLDREILDGAKRLMVQHECTLFMVLLSALDILLYHLCDQAVIVVATPSAGRLHLALENQIGFFAKTLAIRTRLQDEDSFADLLTKVKAEALLTFAHDLQPSYGWIGELDAEQAAGRSPIADVMLSLHGQEAGSVAAYSQPGFEILPLQIQRHTSRFDLLFELLEGKDSVTGLLEFNPDLLNRSTAQRLVREYRQILLAALTNPSLPIAELQLSK